MSFLREFWGFMRVRKKFWLMPIFVMMFLFGGLVVLRRRAAPWHPSSIRYFDRNGCTERAYLRYLGLLSR
jgi:hypothetical protein